MSTIQNLNNGETWLSHRNKLNTNFSNLNTDKVETSVTVNGHDLSSNVTLTTDDVSEGSTNKYDQVVAILAGAGIQVTWTYPNFTVTNSSPDQVVALTAGTNITITGTYPNFTINASGGGGGGGGQVDSVVGGTNISVDSTDPTAPVVSLSLWADDNFVTDVEKTNIGSLDSAAYQPTSAFAPALGTDDNYVTDAEKVVIGNTSGTNSGDQTATTVANTPAGTLSATTVQAAINELDTEKVPTTRTITINGVTQDLSDDRSWTISGGGNSPVVLFSTAWTAYYGKVFKLPAFTGTISKIMISLDTLPAGGNFEFYIAKNGTSMMSGNLTITTTETVSNLLYTVKTGDSEKSTMTTTAVSDEDRIEGFIVAGSWNTFLGAGVTVSALMTAS